MQEGTKRSKIFTRLALALLPASAIPVVLFGYVAIKSHYESLQQQSLAAHQMLVTSMAGHLMDDLHGAVNRLNAVAANDVLKSKNLFMIHEALAGLHSSGNITKALYLDPARAVVAVEPPNPELMGKLFAPTELFHGSGDNQQISSMGTDDAGELQFYATRRIAADGGETLGWLVAEVSVGEWGRLARTLVKSQPGTLGALLPNRKTDVSIRLNEGTDQGVWKKIEAIRAQKTPTDELDLGDEPYYLTSQDVDLIQARLVIARPEAAIFAAPRQVALTYAGALVVLLSVLGILVFILARRITGPVREIADAAGAFADGRMDVRAPVRGRDEVAQLAESFNKMGDSLQVSHLRMRVLYKSIMELFSCNDADNLLRKAVELACTQCLGEVAWFLPHTLGREVAYDTDPIFFGLHGWLWKNHRSVEVDHTEGNAAWVHVEGDRMFAFTMRSQSQEVGILRVAYRKAPDDNMISLLHSLVSLVEMALAKQDLIHKGAMVATELEMAEVVQRNIMADNLLISKTARIAYHYQPASRLGGDWFFLIEDHESDSLYVVMGDVTGHGLAQGLVTTAVKGALDVIEHLMKQRDGSFVCSPAAIVTLLETVVRRVAGRSELTMTCLAAQIDFRTHTLKICNAGHTFPILVREEGGTNVASHLHKNQQPLLGYQPDDGTEFHYAETTYELRAKDLLIIYTDGLTEAKNLKSRIFGRFLFRSLRKPRSYQAAEELRDEILQMFQYYTQNKRIEDDVCFLVVQIHDDVGGAKRSA